MIKLNDDILSIWEKNMNKTTISNEDYLEAILELDNGVEGVKSVKVAELLSVSKAAVSIAMNDLIAKGLVEKESYGNIKLTDDGRNIAKSILKKHEFLKKFLLEIGVSETIASEECCKLEHILSDETLECLEKFCSKNFEKNSKK